jgi:hypothetical protein
MKNKQFDKTIDQLIDNDKFIKEMDGVEKKIARDHEKLLAFATAVTILLLTGFALLAYLWIRAVISLL